MTIDANESADTEVLLPSTTSNDGIDTETKIEPQSTVEPSSTSEETHEQKSKRDFQSRFNEQTKLRYTAEREAKELRDKLESLESSKSTAPTLPLEVVAPSLPEDVYDEDAMRKYHTDMLSYTTAAATSAATSTFENQKKQSLQQSQQEATRKIIDTYTTNAIRDGVDVDKLMGVEQTLNNAGIKPELGHFIMNDNNGAKIAEYLADNPSEMYSILSMDPVSAGIEIATKIKPKVLAQTPKVSNAPQPIADVSGGGYIEKDDFDVTYAGYEII